MTEGMLTFIIALVALGLFGLCMMLVIGIIYFDIKITRKKKKTNKKTDEDDD